MNHELLCSREEAYEGIKKEKLLTEEDVAKRPIVSVALLRK